MIHHERKSSSTDIDEGGEEEVKAMQIRCRTIQKAFYELVIIEKGEKPSAKESF